MKISKIELSDYQQFKDVVLDLTYPKGHKLEGKPLDKICLIGQSGTGKTTILRLIKYFVSRNKSIGQNLFIKIPVKNKIFFHIYQDKLFCRKTVGPDSFIADKHTFDKQPIGFDSYISKSEEYESQHKPLLINYPAEVIRGKLINEIQETKEFKDKKIKDRLDFISTLEPQKIVDFAVEEIENIRNFVFKEIKEHRAKELQFRINMSDALRKDGTTPEDITKLNKKFENWLKANPDPLKILADECLDPLLNRFGLKVKTKIDLETILDLGDIQIQTLTGIDVDRTFWSTGTRHIVDTVLPIFELKPKNAIVLLDEPEKSLYPDIQEIIIDFYIKLAPKCQYFFATHSPIIASSFDPWEVFHLEYDNENKNVILYQNYKNERHVDNYNYYPKYLRWDGILMNVFKLSDEGNSEREKLLLEVATLKREIDIMITNKKQNTITFKKKKEKFISLSNKVGWNESNI